MGPSVERVRCIGRRAYRYRAVPEVDVPARIVDWIERRADQVAA